MKIAYVLRHLPVPSETFVINEIIALQSLGAQVHPISLLPAQLCHEQLMAQIDKGVIDLSGAEIIESGERSPHYHAVTKIAQRFGMSPRLTCQAALVADYLREQGIDHVHAHFATESAFVALTAAKAVGITCTFTAHAYDIFRSEDTGTIRGDSPGKRLRILLEEADGGFTVSEFNRKYILSLTDQKWTRRIGIVRCGIAPEKFSAAPRTGRDTVTILCVGRFVEKKGYEYLLRAFANLKAVTGEARLRLVGEGDLKQSMQDLAGALGIADSVDFLGAVSSGVVHAEMQRADIFALHSVTAANGDMEGIPVSLMEAAAAGLPVVSTLHSGIPELVLDGSTGFLVPERDIEEFSRKLIALSSSSELRDRMGRAGRHYVSENFNQQREAEKLADIFMNTKQERKAMEPVTDRSCMVDIIMPTFNPDKNLISRAIKSIVDQEFQSWKLFVVKDGGNVDLTDVIAAFEDPRIELSEVPHAGKPVALNHAIARGNSKYIAYLDDDDIWYPNHLQTAIAHMEEYGVDFVYTNAHEVNIERAGENLKEVSRKSLGQGTLTELTLVSISHINAVHSRRVIVEAGPYDVERSFFIDWDMFLRMGVISRPVHIDTYTCEHYIYIGADKQHTNTITGIHKNDPERSVKMLQEMYERSLALATPKVFVDFIYDYRSKAWQVENKQKDLDALYEQIGVRDVQIITMTQEFKKKLKELCPEAATDDDLDAGEAASQRKQTLLFVDYEVPRYDMFAGSRTNFMYLAMLVKMGITVKFLAADFQRIEPYSTELNHLGIETLDGDWYRDNWLWWLERNGGDIDYVFFHKPDPATKFLDAVKLHTKAAIIYQCHDLHYLRLQRKYQVEKDQAILDEANLYEKREDHIFLNSDVILTFSDVEEGLIKAKFPLKQVETVPLFFYQSVPETKRDFGARKDLLYVGGFDHTPNRDAVAWFCSEVFPAIQRQIPDIVLNVVGNRPPKEIADLQSKNIRILGKVSDVELNALYSEVRLVVVPLRFGAGVKGKLIEAMYHGVPVVATSIGIEGVKGIEQLIAPQDEPSGFAAQVVSLYRDEARLKDLSLRGTAFVEEHFTTKKTAELMGDILSSCKKKAAARTPATSVAVVTAKEAPSKGIPRLIAFYLPQYHPIPENDKWWGKGFTEWRNVAKAKPLFPGHYQPHIPADLGFYDLRLEETRIAQAELAKQYGIGGFCYYHYWFNGKRLLERPLEELLKSGKPDFPFCICWATENWTRRWDGEDQHVLMEQNYGEEDDRTHIRTLFPIFEDPRYIRVNGKPVFLIYRTENMPDPGRTAEVWREEARLAGIGELYLVRVESIGACDPASINFDAALEFAPDWNNRGPRLTVESAGTGSSPVNMSKFKGVYEQNYIHRYDDLVSLMEQKPTPDYTWFRCVTPSWDNSARRQEGAIVFTDSTPGKYQEWLKKVIEHTKKHRSGEERLIFVNAWNEWAEGNHLEPDHLHGRGYLEATRNALENAQLKPGSGISRENAEALQTMRRHLEQQERQIGELSQKFGELQGRLSEKERLLAEQQVQLGANERRIDDLLNSASWKVTAPLRWAYEMIKKG